MQESLTLALAHWPDFAGTVRMIDGIPGLDRNDTGVRFTVVTTHDRLPDFGIDHPLSLPTSFCDEAIGQTVDDGGGVFTVKISVYNDNHWVMGTCNSHALCDGSGYWQFMQSWRDAFHDITLPTLEGNCCRYIAPHHADTGLPDNLQMPALPLLQQQIANMSHYRSRQLLLPQATLEQLKNRINATLAPDWISTQDALMALLWQSLAKVSLEHGAPATDAFPLGNVINIRSRLGLENYIGNMVFSVCSQASLDTLISTPLPQLALRLRQDSQQIDDAGVHNYLAFMQQQLDQGNVNKIGYFTRFSSTLAAACVHGKGIMINNWSKFPAYAMDFSGKPLWFDLATIIPMHFAMTMPAHDGVVLRLFLPDDWLDEVIDLTRENLDLQ